MLLPQCRPSSVISKMRLVERMVMDSLEKVHLGVANFFQNFLSEMPSTEVEDLSPFLGSRISIEDNLPSTFGGGSEVNGFSIPQHSSPGPDGFAHLFIFLVGIL